MPLLHISRAKYENNLFQTASYHFIKDQIKLVYSQYIHFIPIQETENRILKHGRVPICCVMIDRNPISES